MRKSPIEKQGNVYSELKKRRNTFEPNTTTKKSKTQQEREPTKEEVDQYFKNCLEKFFKIGGPNNTYSKQKKYYDKYDLSLKETTLIKIKHILKLLNEIKMDKEYIKSNEKEVHLLKHGVLNLRSHYYPSKKKESIHTPVMYKSQKKSKVPNYDSESEYDSRESDSSEEFGSLKISQPKLSNTRIAANEEIVARFLSQQKLNEVQQVIKSGVDNYFDEGKRKINKNTAAYSKLEIPLKGLGLSAEEIAAGVHQLHFRLALKNIELDSNAKMVFILGSAANTLGKYYLNANNLPPELKENKSRKRFQKKSSNLNSMELELDLNDDPIELPKDQSSDISLEPIAASETQSLQQTGKRYRPTLFSPANSTDPSSFKKQTLTEEKEILYVFRDNARQHQQEEQELEEIEKAQKEKLIRHISHYIKDIKEICEEFASKFHILEKSPNSQVWQQKISKTNELLSKDFTEFQFEPLKKLYEEELPLLLTILKQYTTEANQYLEEKKVENQQRKKNLTNIKFSDSESESESNGLRA